MILPTGIKGFKRSVYLLWGDALIHDNRQVSLSLKDSLKVTLENVKHCAPVKLATRALYLPTKVKETTFCIVYSRW